MRGVSYQTLIKHVAPILDREIEASQLNRHQHACRRASECLLDQMPNLISTPSQPHGLAKFKRSKTMWFT